MDHARVIDAGAGSHTQPDPREAPGRPLRVCMLTSMFPPSIGGIQTHTLRLGQKLLDRGLEVHVVTRMGPGLPRFERMGGVRVHRVGLPVAGPAGSAAFVADAVRAVVRLQRHLDVLHAHQLLSPSSVGLLAARLTGLPLVVNPHACGTIGDVGVLSASATGRLRLAALVRGADAFVAVSRTIHHELLAAGAPAGAVVSISNGVDTDRFRPAPPQERLLLRRVLAIPEPDAGPLVVYTGRLAPEKGVDVLLEAWPTVLQRVPAARLCILGTGDEEARLRALAASRGVARRVVFQGGVPDVSPHVRAADLAVLPSRTEGMPVALLEAMSCALPVVATRVGGSAEVLEDGATGRLVPPQDPVALGEAVGALLLDPRLAGALGEAARAHVVAHHAMEVVAARFEALYAAVALRRGKRGAAAAPPVGGLA